MKLIFEPAPKPEVTPSPNDWNSWHWQLRNSLKNKDDFSKRFDLSENELKAFDQAKELFNIRVTPYYAALAGSQELDPIHRMLMPQAQERFFHPHEHQDPLGERQNTPVPRIIHRYPDRALFLVTDICSVYCRFCTRKHFTGAEQAFITENEYQGALSYLARHSGIREVILSGGDPLTLSDDQLERVLKDLRTLDHIEVIRIGSRMPVVCPMRVTENLVKTIKKYKPVYLMTHFNHPRELTLEAKNAVELFVDNGIPLFNQMVLLNGVNNHPAVVQALSRRLLYLRVKPYYMFQCDPSEGTDHLRISIEDALSIQKELWGTLSGLALPMLSLDIPGGGGKVGLVPDFELERINNGRIYQGWDGIKGSYINPDEKQKIKPWDWSEYEAEWLATQQAKKTPNP